MRIWHQGDDVLVLSLKTKMHAIGPGVIAGLDKALAEAEKNYKGLVLWNADAAAGGPFSAGADLQSMLPLFMSGGVKAIEPEVAKLQQAHLAMKYANVPVVAAVAGLALGGGCELLMHAAKRVAALESYIGLVEVGVGLIPAGGGLKEAALRAAADANGQRPAAVPEELLHESRPPRRCPSRRWKPRRWATSAPMTSSCSTPTSCCMWPRSRRARCSMPATGRRCKALVPVAGRYGMATIMMQLVNMRDGGFISAHDYKLGAMIAEIVCGGEVEAGSLVTSSGCSTWSARPSWSCSTIPRPRNASWA